MDKKIIIGLFVAIGGGILISYVYNKNKKPSLEGLDKIKNEVTYIWKGAKRVSKLNPDTSFELGDSGYSFTPKFDSAKKLISVSLMKNGKVVDSL